MWDLGSNQTMQVAQHEAPVKTVHYVKAPNYTCLMTTSWDKTIKVRESVCLELFIYVSCLALGPSLTKSRDDSDPV